MRTIAGRRCTLLCNGTKIFDNALYHISQPGSPAQPRVGRLQPAISFVLSFPAKNLTVLANAGVRLLR